MSIETFTHEGFTVEIHYDEDAGSPREWDNGTKMVLSHGRYDLANEIGLDCRDFDGWAAVESYLRAEYDIVGLLQVRGYDHSGLALSTSDGGQFSDPWDSGTLGFIFMDRDGQAEMGTPDDLVDEVLTGDVETYSAWMNGESYGYVVKAPDGTEVESCWGFIASFDDCVDEAKAVATSAARERDEALQSEAAMERLPVLLTL